MTRSWNDRSMGHEHGARADARKTKKVSIKKVRRSDESNSKVLRLIQKSVRPTGWMRIKRQELF